MEHDVIEELFVTYYNDALLYTLSLTGNKADAEDIVSTAFHKAIATADDEVQNFKAWLFAVCRNLYISQRRRHSRFPTVEFNEANAGHMEDEAERVVDSIVRDEEYRALYRAIELLPPLHREVITLFYFENLPVRAIAEIVGKSETNIKVTLCRAREGLKKILEAGS